MSDRRLVLSVLLLAVTLCGSLLLGRPARADHYVDTLGSCVHLDNKATSLGGISTDSTVLVNDCDVRISYSFCVQSANKICDRSRVGGGAISAHGRDGISLYGASGKFIVFVAACPYATFIDGWDGTSNSHYRCRAIGGSDVSDNPFSTTPAPVAAAPDPVAQALNQLNKPAPAPAASVPTAAAVPHSPNVVSHPTPSAVPSAAVAQQQVLAERIQQQAAAVAARKAVVEAAQIKAQQATANLQAMRASSNAAIANTTMGVMGLLMSAQSSGGGGGESYEAAEARREAQEAQDELARLEAEQRAAEEQARLAEAQARAAEAARREAARRASYDALIVAGTGSPKVDPVSAVPPANPFSSPKNPFSSQN